MDPSERKRSGSHFTPERHNGLGRLFRGAAEFAVISPPSRTGDPGRLKGERQLQYAESGYECHHGGVNARIGVLMVGSLRPGARRTGWEPDPSRP